MRSLVLALIAIFGLSGAVHAQTSPEVPGVKETIQSQMEAFTAEDPALAFTFASPFIQRMFGTPENFGTMVQRSYPMVWDNREVTYLDQRVEGGMLLQRLRILDEIGGEHWFAYQMIQIEGKWRINGVFPLEAPDVSV